MLSNLVKRKLQNTRNETMVRKPNKRNNERGPRNI